VEEGAQRGGSFWSTSPGLWARPKPEVRRMRKAPTPAEDRLWQEVRRGYAGIRFRRQPNRPIRCRLLLLEASLVLEVDGSVHATSHDQDRNRQNFLESSGLRILRFTNEEVLQSLENVLSRIDEALTTSPPLPLPPLHLERGTEAER
jgi:very-short-patch-repair endonuclease